MNTIPEDDDDWISKTQRKKECDDMQQLGEDLLKLQKSELLELNLPDILHNALDDAHRIHQRGALKRQKQYIGKIMRDVDVDEIQKQYDDLTHKHDLNNAHFKRLEKWRDRIIEEGDSILNELIDTFPDIDRQHVRQLIRKAKKEKDSNKPAGTYKQIFKYLRDLSES